MTEEKKEDIAFEVFGKRLEELKEMTENIGKTEKSKSSIGAESKKKTQIIPPQKIQEKMPVPEPLKNNRKKLDSFRVQKIKSSEPKRKQNVLKGKRVKVQEIEHPTLKSFFGMHKQIGDKPPQKIKIKEHIIVQRIPSAERHEIFANLKQLDEKIDKNKEEMYNRLIQESAESKRMIESEREEIKKHMIELLAESIDRLDSKDREIKGELYEELQKIKNKFYGEKKEIRNLFMKGSEESRKMLESEREKIKGEFLAKIANLRNRIN